MVEKEEADILEVVPIELGGRLRRLGGIALVVEMMLASFSAVLAAAGLRLFLIQFCRDRRTYVCR